MHKIPCTMYFFPKIALFTFTTTNITEVKSDIRISCVTPRSLPFHIRISKNVFSNQTIIGDRSRESAPAFVGKCVPVAIWEHVLVGEAVRVRGLFVPSLTFDTG